MIGIGIQDYRESLKKEVSLPLIGKNLCNLRDYQFFNWMLKDIGFNLDTYESVSRYIQGNVLEAAYLFMLGSSVPKGGKILEIGCGNGGSLLCFFLGAMLSGNAPEINFITIDPFRVYYEEQTRSMVKRDRGGNETLYKEVLQKYGIKCRHIRANSYDARIDIAKGSCDIVYVDGNHSYKTCWEDLTVYWPRLKSNGILIGHDYHPLFGGVIRAVDQFEKEYKHRCFIPYQTTMFLFFKDVK